ncbi:uncharacterized protein LOC113340836 [Papaver somniferum]|uniref:uncharacterized protein LOC113340836 n=1 Tax=Papaver somniferum TaxID=3469 RepID=UPI000E6F6C98|nr:uncharacterized protein LOC113340836 [Papaver somniferum]
METQCGVCGRGEETIEHLIFECIHARSVWRSINIDIDAVKANCSSVSEWVLSWFNGSSTGMDERLLFTCMIGAWIIWKDRCEKIFQGVNLNPISTTSRIQYHLSSHLHENLICSPYNINTAKSNWLPPTQGIAKFNVDTSFDHNTNQNGTGVVLRDHAEMNLDDIQIEVDAQVVIKVVNEDPWVADAQVVIKAVYEAPWVAQ